MMVATTTEQPKLAKRTELDSPASEALGGKICTAAGLAAQSECQGMCQFTGCHHTRHLKAHHLIHWADGGRTDLDNLILLCQLHHTVVHEGDMIIRRGAERRWEFLMPDGKPHRDWYTAEGLMNFFAQHADRSTAERGRAARTTMIDNVSSFHHPDALRIQAGWRGERFDRHEAVQALFRMPINRAA